MTVNDKAMYYPKLDGLRFYAFLLVFIHHFPPISNKILLTIYERGWVGVELFFVISAYLLTVLLINELKYSNSINLKKYFIRRILRIWPLFYVYIVLMLVYKFIFIGLDNLMWLRIIGLLTFTDNILTSHYNYNSSLPYVGHLWTISLEEQFYFILPFIIPILAKKSREIIIRKGIIIWLTLIAFRFMSISLKVSHPFIWVLPIQCDAFLVGILMGFGTFDVLLDKYNSELKIFIGIIILVLTTLIPNVNIIGKNQLIIYGIVSISFMLIVNGVLNSNNNKIDILLTNRFTRYMGKISFGLYVFHIACIDLSKRIVKDIIGINFSNSTVNWLLYFIVAILFTIILSILSYELLEKRFLILKNRFAVIRSRPV